MILCMIFDVTKSNQIQLKCSTFDSIIVFFPFTQSIYSMDFIHPFISYIYSRFVGKKNTHTHLFFEKEKYWIDTKRKIDGNQFLNTNIFQLFFLILLFFFCPLNCTLIEDASIRIGHRCIEIHNLFTLNCIDGKNQKNKILRNDRKIKEISQIKELSLFQTSMQ